MIHTELFLEGVQLDIADDVQALFSYAVADVADFSARNTSWSTTISVPGTPHNNAVFGNIFEFTALSGADPSQLNVGRNFNAGKVAQGLVLQHSIQVFKGVIRLLEIKCGNGAISYQITLFGELGGLAAAIGAKLLTGNAIAAQDLNFSAYDQSWTVGNISASWTARNSTGGGSGVFFPLIDYGGVSPIPGVSMSAAAVKRDYWYKAMRPALYVKEYVDKIITGAGYTYEAPFFATDFFKRLIIPHNEDQLYRLTGTFVDARASSDISPLLNAAVPSGAFVFLTYGAWSTMLNFINTATGYPTGTVYTYNVPPPAQAIVSTRIKLVYVGGEGKIKVTLQIRKNGAPVATKDIVLAGTTAANVYPPDIDLSASIGLVNGDQITVVASPSGTGLGPPAIAWRVDFLTGSTLSVKPLTAAATPAVYGDQLSMSQAIPKNITQRDFLLSIVKMFNLMVIEDPTRRRHLKIMPYRSGMAGVTDFFNNANPLDWSGKMDRSGEITLKPLALLTARYYKYLYAEDSDYFNETYRNRYGAGYGDRTQAVQNDFVSDTAELKVIFAPTPMVGPNFGAYFARDKYVSAMYKINASSGVATEERIATKIRILQTSRQIVATAWNILSDTGTTLGSYTQYGFASHVDSPFTPLTDLNFGTPREIYWDPANGKNSYAPANVFNAFHSPYLAEISDRDSRLLTAYFRLTPMDIAGLDFARSIYIDGQLWRLNKIIDFDSVREGLTKVELLRVINLNY